MSKTLYTTSIFVAPTTSSLRSTARRARSSAATAACFFCYYRKLHDTSRFLQSSPHSVSTSDSPKSPAATVSSTTKNLTTTTTAPANTASSSTAQAASSQTIRPRPNRPHVRRYDGELVPKPLNRPLGLRHPPQPGQNSGIDTRSFKQRRDDFASYDKHLQRRHDLIKNLYEKNYFRDMGNIGKIHKGKSILAPSTPFRANLALYFPNLQGRTLVKGAPSTVDTTPVLKGKVSIVSFLSSDWAKAQCSTFVGEKENPELHAYLNTEQAKSVAQMVEVNVEENWLKWALIRAFFYRLRRIFKKENWGRYFLVRRGINDDIRDALGVWNSKVGYVYLLDGACRVRWAGNGPAKEDERKSLVNCLKRLVDEARGVKRLSITRLDANPTGPAPAAATAAQSVT